MKKHGEYILPSVSLHEFMGTSEYGGAKFHSWADAKPVEPYAEGSIFYDREGKTHIFTDGLFKELSEAQGAMVQKICRNFESRFKALERKHSDLDRLYDRVEHLEDFLNGGPKEVVSNLKYKIANFELKSG